MDERISSCNEFAQHKATSVATYDMHQRTPMYANHTYQKSANRTSPIDTEAAQSNWMLELTNVISCAMHV